MDLSPQIVADNIKATGASYYGAMLEELKAFDVVDRIMEMYSNGQLSIGASESGDLLYDYWKGRSNRMTQAERRTLYARALGLPGGDTETTSNREFATLWLRFVTSVAGFVIQRALDSVNGAEVDQEHVRTAARQLAANVSLHGYGMTAAAARLQEDIEAIWKLLSSADLQHAFATHRALQLVEHVAARDLGGAASTHPYEKARAGAVVFAWLATRASQLSAVSGTVLNPAVILNKQRAPSPTTNPTDYDLVNACEQWLAVAGSNNERIET